MELISTKIVKSMDLGVHGNFFGGKMMSLIDESAAAYASQLCYTPRMVTLKVSEVLFKKAVKHNSILKIYGEVIKVGNTSITIRIQVNKLNTYKNEQEEVTSAELVFVHIDEEGNPISISSKAKKNFETIKFNEKK